jgi:phosphatidate cytidylyltransferase
MKRVVTSLVLLPVAIFLVLFAPVWALLIAVAVVASVCYHEYASLAKAFGLNPFGPVGYGAGVALLIAPTHLFELVVVIALLGLLLGATGDLRSSLPRAAVLVGGVLYAFGAWKFAILLHGLNPYWLLFALSINWAGDVSAYYAGRSFGRHKLAPRISPGKTWEGTIVSLLASAIYGWLFITRLLPAVSPAYAVVIAIVANAAGQFGDLAESAIKRGAGVKDSGTLLPGHGGALDRLDSTLFTLPVVYMLVTPW